MTSIRFCMTRPQTCITFPLSRRRQKTALEIVHGQTPCLQENRSGWGGVRSEHSPNRLSLQSLGERRWRSQLGYLPEGWERKLLRRRTCGRGDVVSFVSWLRHLRPFDLKEVGSKATDLLKKKRERVPSLRRILTSPEATLGDFNAWGCLRCRLGGASSHKSSGVLKHPLALFGGVFKSLGHRVFGAVKPSLCEGSEGDKATLVSPSKKGGGCKMLLHSIFEKNRRVTNFNSSLSTRPVATVPRPVIENTSSTAIKNGFSHDPDNQREHNDDFQFRILRFTFGKSPSILDGDGQDFATQNIREEEFSNPSDGGVSEEGRMSNIALYATFMD
ncbi:hypothetical protein RRG08_006436 [Elysia crispata]|uniref:Uncharacterized protein n=1 Tax=Elysia crispata TaxID=231223 RepID=A0AAE0YIX8_9GAST|nr:hypothetical protein RRG08_006436 [Elysia crispata]